MANSPDKSPEGDRGLKTKRAQLLSVLSGKGDKIKSERPTDFKRHLDFLPTLKEEHPADYVKTIGEIRKMSTGKNPGGVRNYYPKWENKDFADLLQELGESVN